MWQAIVPTSHNTGITQLKTPDTISFFDALSVSSEGQSLNSET